MIFTSDNGSNGRNGGSNFPLAGTKGTTMEGGMRVPMIARWPGKISPGTECGELTTTMDILPTFCHLSGARGPAKKIDGYAIHRLLLGDEDARSPYSAFFYYRRRQLQAVRVGKYKYHLPLERTFPRWHSPSVTGKGRSGKLVEVERESSMGEDSGAREEILLDMKWRVDRMIRELGNEKDRGIGQRESLTLEKSAPLVLGEN